MSLKEKLQENINKKASTAAALKKAAENRIKTHITKAIEQGETCVRLRVADINLASWVEVNKWAFMEGIKAPLPSDFEMEGKVEVTIHLAPCC